MFPSEVNGVFSLAVNTHADFSAPSQTLSISTKCLSFQQMENRCHFFINVLFILTANAVVSGVIFAHFYLCVVAAKNTY